MAEEVHRRLRDVAATRQRALDAYRARMAALLAETNRADAPAPPGDDEDALLRAYLRRRVDDVCRFFSAPVRGQRADSGALFPCTVAPAAHRLLSCCLGALPACAHDGKHVVLAAVLLAAKAAHVHPSGPSFAGRVPNTDAGVLLRLETAVLAAGGFDVPVPRAADALAALVLERKDSMRASLWAQGCAALERLFRTDLALVLSDREMAAAALSVVAGEDCGCPLDAQTVLRMLDESAAMDARVTAQMEAVRALDARLISLRRLDPLSIHP